MNDRTPPALRLAGITKRFGDLVANDSISLTLAGGEVLALLGENGAGKSTLVSILFGHYVADAGTIEVFGKPLAPGDPAAALAAGIGMVHQHFTLADNLSVQDNIVLGTQPLWSLAADRAGPRARLLATAERFGLRVDPAARVGSLSVGERQRVEILKALYRDARILILDEPTSVLTPQEAAALFATLARLVAEGLSIIFISHKLTEVLRVSDRIAVLRAGKLVATLDSATADRTALAELMVGRSVRKPVAREHRRGETVCALTRVSVGDADGARVLDDVSLAVRAGEIVGIAGVSGNGQEALAELLSRPAYGRRRNGVGRRNSATGRTRRMDRCRRGANPCRSACGGCGRRLRRLGERDCRAVSKAVRERRACCAARPRESTRAR